VASSRPVAIVRVIMEPACVDRSIPRVGTALPVGPSPYRQEAPAGAAGA
jgi:hypothetical protein